MTEGDPIEKIQRELQAGMKLDKCKKCGCMKDTLESLYSSLSSIQIESASELRMKIEKWLKQMQPSKYTCLGCEHCFPAVVTNIFNSSFPDVIILQSPSCAFEVKEEGWPPVPGEYFDLRDDGKHPVAVSTLSSIGLAEKLARIKPEGLCIVGKTETENIGVEKLIKNTISNPAIRFLLLTGKDPKGHNSGKTMLALWANGIDQNLKVIDSPGKRPILKNVTRDEVKIFRNQVKVVDLIGCEDVETIAEKIKELSQELSVPCCCEECTEKINPVQILSESHSQSCGCNTCTEETNKAQSLNVPIIQAKEYKKTEMDAAGYFVILPQKEKGIITVEYYSYDNKLLGIVEGENAESIYITVIKNNWVTQLSHAAYLGKELAKAELSITFGFKYVQDAA